MRGDYENHLTERAQEITEALRRTQEESLQVQQQLQAIKTESRGVEADLETYNRFAARVDAFPRPSSIRDATRQLISDIVAVTAEMDQRLSERAALEAKVEEANEQNKNLAAQVERLEQELKTYEAAIADLVEIIAQQERAFGEVQAAYDEKAHQEAHERKTTLVAHEARLSTEVKSLEENIERFEREKARMDEVKKPF